MGINEKSLGQLGEEFAQQHYKNHGCEIIAANFFNKTGLRKGEIDFIAKIGQQIIFVEVKTRDALEDAFGGGAESVNHFKQLKLLRAVKLFFLEYPEYEAFVPQIDVCLVTYREFDKPPFSAIIIPNAVDDWN